MFTKGSELFLTKKNNSKLANNTFKKFVKASRQSNINIFQIKEILSKRTNFCFRSPSIVTLLSPKRERKKKCNSLHITKEPFFRQQQAKEIVTKSPDFLLWCEKNPSKVFVCKSDWVFDILDVLRPLEKR